MIFTKPHILFFIWVVPLVFLLFIYGMKRRATILESYASRESLSVICQGILKRYRLIKAVLLSFSLLFMIFSLSGIKYGYRWQEVSRRGIDIIIALDCSKSMLATDISPTRLKRAKREVYDLLSMLQGDRVGLVAFSGTAFLQCPLTIDYDAYNLFLKALTPDFLPVGGTHLTKALQVALESFETGSNSEKAVILITDGEHTGEDDPVKAASVLKEQGIKLFTVGVGDEKGAPIPLAKGGFQKDRSGKIILTRLDERMLQQMSVLTGGRYVRSVSGDMDLDVIYSKEIRGKMDVSELTSGRKKILEDRFQWPLLLAILFLLIELLLPSKLKNGVIKGKGILILCLIVISAPYADANPLKKGLSAYEKGAYEEALQHFLDAQIASPEKPEVAYNLGNTYYKLGDFEKAYTNYERALQSENMTVRGMTRYNLGNTSFRKGDLKKAVEHYDEALKIDPEDVNARENLEFVKKEMEKKPQQPQKGSDQDKKDPEKKDEKDQQQGASKKEEDGKRKEKEPASPEKKEESSSKENEKDGGKEDKDNEMKEDDGKEASSDQEDKDSSQQGADSKDQKKPSKGKEEKGSIRASDEMLDRLKDEPGKALIPLYQQQPVEKDW